MTFKQPITLNETLNPLLSLYYQENVHTWFGSSLFSIDLYLSITAHCTNLPCNYFVNLWDIEYCARPIKNVSLSACLQNVCNEPAVSVLRISLLCWKTSCDHWLKQNLPCLLTSCIILIFCLLLIPKTEPKLSTEVLLKSKVLHRDFFCHSFH